MDLSRYAIHGMTPSRAERPTTTEGLAQTIRAAHDAREAVVLWGGGTRLAIGEPPTRYDIAVVTRARQLRKKILRRFMNSSKFAANVCRNSSMLLSHRARDLSRSEP